MRALAIALVVCIHSLVAADDGMRCDQRLVSVGDSEATVLARCGTPTTAETERHNRRDHGAVRRCVIDRWTYDRGPSDFVRTLRFEDGLLAGVDVGSWGGP